MPIPSRRADTSLLKDIQEKPYEDLKSLRRVAINGQTMKMNQHSDKIKNNASFRDLPKRKMTSKEIMTDELPEPMRSRSVMKVSENGALPDGFELEHRIMDEIERN